MNSITQYLETYYDEVEPLDFYRQIFPDGQLEEKGVYQEGMYTGILLQIARTEERSVRRYTVTDDLEVIRDAIQSDDFCIMSPISYAGKSRTAENARYLYAIAVDVDMIKIVRDMPVGLMSLLERHIREEYYIGGKARIPKPTFVVSSGSGVHLYYVLDRPIAMYKETVKQLQAFKRELTNLIWHETICSIKSKQDIQQEGIFQGFRVVGSITKTGERARAFQIGEKVSIRYLNDFVDMKYRVGFLNRKKLSLADAKRRYPEWFERRVVNHEPRGAWHVSRSVYDWWKSQILSGAAVGHRYYCIMLLAMYAKKCSYYDEKRNPNPVTYEELETDAFMLMDVFDKLTVEESNHFTRDDVLQALQAFDEKWITYPRTAIQYKSGISIPENRRNGRKQSKHLEYMRWSKIQMDNAVSGAPSKMMTVLRWKAEHPGGWKSDCARDTGLSMTTISKWWDGKIENSDGALETVLGKLVMETKYGL